VLFAFGVAPHSSTYSSPQAREVVPPIMFRRGAAKKTQRVKDAKAKSCCHRPGRKWLLRSPEVDLPFRARKASKRPPSSPMTPDRPTPRSLSPELTSATLPEASTVLRNLTFKRSAHKSRGTTGACTTTSASPRTKHKKHVNKLDALRKTELCSKFLLGDCKRSQGLSGC